MRYPAGILVSSLLVVACSNPEDDESLRAAFSTVLKDPSSLQFQRVNETDKVICGEYNSKNSYGAYAGFEAFSFDRTTQTLTTENEAQDDGGKGYGKFLDALTGCDKDNKIFFGINDRLSRKIHQLSQ